MAEYWLYIVLIPADICQGAHTFIRAYSPPTRCSWRRGVPRGEVSSWWVLTIPESPTPSSAPSSLGVQDDMEHSVLCWPEQEHILGEPKPEGSPSCLDLWNNVLLERGSKNSWRFGNKEKVRKGIKMR